MSSFLLYTELSRLIDLFNFISMTSFLIYVQPHAEFMLIDLFRVPLCHWFLYSYPMDLIKQNSHPLIPLFPYLILLVYCAFLVFSHQINTKPIYYLLNDPLFFYLILTHCTRLSHSLNKPFI